MKQNRNNLKARNHDVSNISSIDNFGVFEITPSILFAIKFDGKNFFLMVFCPYDVVVVSFWRKKFKDMCM
ncbi:hypothetical protein [Algoriphagus sp.]|uniref:hypothetical protein n=1 Tax=Algoriphagus sp. TaxID=1872435 RepID=UPI003F729C45